MPPLSPEKRADVARLILEGHSYDEVSKLSDVSKGSVVNIAKELKEGRFRGLENVANYFDELRELAVKLRKAGLTVKDATKGLEVYFKLQSLGVGLDGLERLIKLARGLESGDYKIEEIVPAAVELLKLEEKLGKKLFDALREAEEEASKLERIKEERTKAEAEFSKIKDELSSKQEALKKLIDTDERLRKLGLDKVSALSEFLDGCVKLGFNAEEAKRIARLGMEKDSLEREVKKLKSERIGLQSDINRLKNELSKITRVKRILFTGGITLPCKFCNSHSVYIKIESIEESMRTGMPLACMCMTCGRWPSYSVWEIAWYLTQFMLPAIRKL